MLQHHGFGLGKMLVAFRHIHAVEPRFLRGAGAVEEQHVGGNGRVRRKHRRRQAHDSMQVEIPQQFALYLGLVAAAEKEAVRNDHSGAARSLEARHNKDEEEVSRFRASHIRREILLDDDLLTAAVGRIHKDDIELVGLGVVAGALGQGVAVGDERLVHAVEQKVGHTEQVRQGLLFHTVEGLAQDIALGDGSGLRREPAASRVQEAARSAGEVRHLVANLEADVTRHEIREGAGRVELAGTARALQELEDGLVDSAEGVGFLRVVEVALVYFADELAQEHAILHEVMDIGEHRFHDALPARAVGRNGQVFERGQKRAVHKADELVALEGRAVHGVRPVAPAAFFRDDGFVVLVHGLPVVFLVVVYLEEQHPGKLFDALGVAVDALIEARDVAHFLDEGREAHGYSVLLCVVVKDMFHLADGAEVAFLVAERLEYLLRAAEVLTMRGQGLNAVYLEDAVVRVGVEQVFQHLTRHALIFFKELGVADFAGSKLAGQQFAAERDVAYHVELVEVGIAEFLLQVLDKNTARLKLFLDDGLGLRAVPRLAEGFFRGEAGKDVAAGVVFEFLDNELAVFIQIADGFTRKRNIHTVHNNDTARLFSFERDVIAGRRERNVAAFFAAIESRRAFLGGRIAFA